jgi:hypothetical protein
LPFYVILAGKNTALRYERLLFLTAK